MIDRDFFKSHRAFAESYNRALSQTFEFFQFYAISSSSSCRFACLRCSSIHRSPNRMHDSILNQNVRLRHFHSIHPDISRAVFRDRDCGSPEGFVCLAADDFRAVQNFALDDVFVHLSRADWVTGRCEDGEIGSGLDFGMGICERGEEGDVQDIAGIVHAVQRGSLLIQYVNDAAIVFEIGYHNIGDQVEAGLDVK